MGKFIVALVLMFGHGLTSAATVLVMGDSISAAYGIRQDQGWIALLRQKLNDENLNVKVINSSITGETTAGGLARLGKELKRHQPTIVIIELGGNDGLRGLAPKVMKKNLSGMINLSKDMGADTILLGMRIPPNYGKRYTEMFSSVYYQLAQEHKVAFVPFLLDGIGTRSDLMQADGIHPNEDAQPLIMEYVLEKLKPLISSPG